MIAKLAKGTAYFFVEKEVIKKEDEEVYAYGIELLYSSVLNILLAVMIAIITDTLFTTAVFLVAFIMIRQYIGGYHANTHLGCMLTLAAVLLVFILLTRYIPNYFESVIAVTSTIASVILVFAFAPVEHPNKPLSNEDKIRLRKRGLIAVLLISILILTLTIFNITKKYGMYIALGTLTSSIAMLCEVIKHKRTCKYNEN